MTKMQQDVLIYKEKAFTTAQRQFEKDLRKRQQEGWRLVSITPTKKRGFGRIVELTAIYERVPIDNSYTSAQANVDGVPIPVQMTGTRAEAKAKRRERIKEARKRAREKEQAYRESLRPEQLQRYLKRERRKSLIIAAVVLVLLVVCVVIANDPTMQAIINADLTPVPTDTPTPTPTPIDLTTHQGVEAYTREVISNMSNVPFGQLEGVAYTASTKELQVLFYIPSNQVWDNNHLKNMIEINCYDVEHAIWTSKLKNIIAEAGVHIESDLVDKYNNTSKGEVGEVMLKAETAKLFNWDDNAFELAWNDQAYDSQWMLPSLNN